MAQHDYIISNQTFPNTRADINNVLQALATNNSGTTAPTTQYAGQFWLDTNTPSSTTWTLYIHDGSDDIAFATIDTSANTVNFTDSALDVVTDTTPQLGGNLDLNSNDITGTGNINITGSLTASGNLTSLGIDDNATSTAITIDSSERVGLGRTPTNAPFEIQTLATDLLRFVGNNSQGNYMRSGWYKSDNSTNLAFLNVDGDVQLTFGTTTATPIQIYSNNSERLRITSAGLVGIGTSSPSEVLHVVGDILATGGDFKSDANNYLGFSNNTFARFVINDSEKMRIDSSGSVFFSTGGNDVSASQPGASFLRDTSGSNAGKISLQLGTPVSGADTLATFFNSNGGVGSIVVSGSATAYNTSSDYRLKENVSYDFDATTRLKQLKPARFNFITDADTTVDGFLAHEVSSVVPEAISGEKDATETKEKVVVNANGNVIAENIEQADWETGKIANENGNTKYPIDSTWEATKVVPVYQGIDQSKLVPLLVKTIQELEARITTLEANNP